MTFLEELQQGFQKMLDFRKSVGYATDTYRSMVTPFINFCGANYPDHQYISQDMLDAWLAHYSYTPNNQAAFIACVREYTKFLCFLDRDDFVPDEDYSIHRTAYAPYLFQDNELKCLFHAFDDVVPHTCGIRLLPQLVLPVYSRLLYCCGMRPQEPPALLRRDVDIQTGDVYIRQSKRHKDRHIIVSDDMLLLMQKYDEITGEREYFFQRYDGKPYTTEWYYANFLKCWSSTGIQGPSTPRPYDLRHAFATRNLMKWINSGEDVLELMPYLSAYMGHSEITSTLYYIHLLPENLRKSCKIDWEKLNNIYS